MSVGSTRKGFTQAKFNDDAVNIIIGEIFISVSYTHLTLPTIYSV